jgi:hypothetical protein
MEHPLFVSDSAWPPSNSSAFDSSQSFFCMSSHLPLSRLRLLHVRNESVLLDSDLAALYGVETKVFNQAMRRNARRFPKDFAFRLNMKEWRGLRSQIVTLKSQERGVHRKYVPWVFTEHGAIMAATILKSARAIAMSTYVVRVFVRLRRDYLASTTLQARLTKIEKELLTHDSALRSLYRKIRPLLLPPPELPAKEMGFHTGIRSFKGTATLPWPL